MLKTLLTDETVIWTSEWRANLFRNLALDSYHLSHLYVMQCRSIWVPSFFVSIFVRFCSFAAFLHVILPTLLIVALRLMVCDGACESQACVLPPQMVSWLRRQDRGDEGEGHRGRRGRWGEGVWQSTQRREHEHEAQGSGWARLG